MAGVLCVTVPAFAQAPTAMAPPVPASPSPSGGSAGADSVFNWREIPQNQQVPLTRGVFDQGGYQLYDTVGETIVVPFTNQNLYVMKFVVSPSEAMYFVNQGGVPVLYVPRYGYLENATVSGARWYPFGKAFHPAQPVYLGIAPSWSVFVGMGWYPNMYCYGGYWSRSSFLVGGVFGPSIGLFFRIGGHPYYGWNGYHQYALGHPGFAHIGYYHRDFTRFAGRPHGPGRPFGGVMHGFAGTRGFGGAHHGFGVGNHAFATRPAFRGAQGSFGHAGAFGRPVGGTHTFRGGAGGGQSGHGAFRGVGGQRGGGGSPGGFHADGMQRGGGGRMHAGGMSHGGGGHVGGGGHGHH